MSVFVCYGICKHQGNQFLPYEGFFMPNLYLQNYRIENSITSCNSDGGVSGRVFLQPTKQACFMVTAKPAELQKKALNIRRWSGKAVRAPTVQIQIGISASSTDLQQSGSTGQGSLTALEQMLISLAPANETISLGCAILCCIQFKCLLGFLCFDWLRLAYTLSDIGEFGKCGIGWVVSF